MDNLFYIYAALLLAFSGLTFQGKSGHWNSHALYWIFSTPLILFTALRPWGIMRDDRAYLAIFNNLSSDHFENGLFSRDALWFALIFTLKSISQNVAWIQVTAASVLFIKLLLLQTISKPRNQLIVLFVYTCSYWQLHDLTQFRGSLAALFLIAFFWYTLKNRATLRFASLALAIQAHNSAIATLIYLVERPIVKIVSLIRRAGNLGSSKNIGTSAQVHQLGSRPYRFPVMLSTRTTSIIVVTLLALIQIGAYPDLGGAIGFFNSSAQESTQHLSAQLNLYNERALDGNYQSYRALPAILIVTIACYLFMLRSLRCQHTDVHIQIAARSLIISCFLAWMFASISDVQVRYYELFLLGGLVLVGTIRSTYSFLAAAVVGVAYFAKFNILWSIWSV